LSPQSGSRGGQDHRVIHRTMAAVLEETVGVLVSDDRERRPGGFEQGFSAAGLGLAQEAYTVEPTSYFAFSAKFGFSVCVEPPRILPSFSTVDCALWRRRTVSERSFEPKGGRPGGEAN
jgi:hypothetical protein